MAESYCSVNGDIGGVTAIHYNPASSSRLRNFEASFMGQKGVSDDSFGSFFFGKPTELGTFSGYINYYSVGDVELVDTQGVSRTVKSQDDLTFNFNYGAELRKGLSAGINAKVLRSKLLDEFSAMALAADFGFQSALHKKISLGLAIQNLGTKIKYADESQPLPLTFRGGVSTYQSFDDLGNALLSLDFVKEREEKLKEFLGFEYGWNNLVAIRAGYKFGQSEGKLNFGMGFTAGRFQIDYALTEMGTLGRTHMASLGIKFGEIVKDEDDRDIKPATQWLKDLEEQERKKKQRQ